MQNCKSSERKKLENKKTKLGETNAKLYDVINELNTLSTSTQVYDIIEDKSYNDSGNAIGYGAKDNSVTKYNPKTGIVEIRLGNTTDEMVAHELKHAYQFEVGELVSNAKGWVEEYYGQDKEQAAYDRQALFYI